MCFWARGNAARIEGSKAFATRRRRAAGVAPANSEIVDSPAHLDAALDRFAAAGDPAWVVKDALASRRQGCGDSASRARNTGVSARGQHPVLLESHLTAQERCLCVVDRTVAVPCRRNRTSSESVRTTPTLNTGVWLTPLPWPPDNLMGCGQAGSSNPLYELNPARKPVFADCMLVSAITARGPAVEFNCRFGDPRPCRAGLAGVSARPIALPCRRYREAGRFRRVAVTWP